MKVKIDVTEVRVEELTAVLSRKTEEAQLLKVLQTDTPPQREKRCLFHSLIQIPKIYALDSSFFLLIQNEAEVAFSENNVLKKACEAAEKAKEDLMEKSTVAEVVFFLLQSCLIHCYSFFEK